MVTVSTKKFNLINPMQDFNIPILLIIFKRYDSLVAQIDILRAIRPANLYVFADGPRTDEEAADCIRARSALKGIDWHCEIRTKFMDTNLGCGKGPATAINWFFENEPEGIILEDDLLPHTDFFRFCSELLERFRDDIRIMEISGSNRLGQWGDGTQSYCYSQWGSECGWATWRRAWRHFDYTVRAWADPRTRGVIRDIYRSPLRIAFFSRILEQTYRHHDLVTWWDYQWGLAKNLNQGLSVVPTVNLVRNVGCDQHSNHDRDASHRFVVHNDLKGMDFPLRHPSSVNPDHAFDDALLRKAMSLRHYFSSMIPDRIKRLLKRLIDNGKEAYAWIP